MTHRSICLPPCRNGRKSAPQIPARRRNEHESSLNDAFAIRGSIRAAIPRDINRVLMQVVDHQSQPAPGFRGPTDYKSGETHIAGSPDCQFGAAPSGVFRPLLTGLDAIASRDQSPIRRRSQFAFEAHALGNPEARDDAPLDSTLDFGSVAVWGEGLAWPCPPRGATPAR
jgi:hypothetical protein